MYSKRTVTLALTLLLLSSYFIIDFDKNPPKNREARLSNTVTLSKDDLYIRTRFAGGNGSIENPYQISEAFQLQNIQYSEDYLEYYYILINDVDAIDTYGWNEGAGFNPIGYDTYVFTGCLDGRGYSIKGLFMNIKSHPAEMGLFEQIGVDGVVKNLSLIDINMSGNQCIGGIAGMNNQGTLQNCQVTGKVYGESGAGGLVGLNEGIVNNCSSNIEVTGNDYSGGMVGLNLGIVENCSTIGNITGKGSVGGLVGDNEGTVNNCSATGNMTGEDDVGGLLGKNYGNVQNCYATGNVTGEYNIGGLAGDNEGIVKNSSSVVEAIGFSNVGGFTGFNVGTVENCYATVKVTGNYNVGGFVGCNERRWEYDLEEYKGGTLENCSTTGKVTGDDEVGGLIGYNVGTVENCSSTGTVMGGNRVGGLVGFNVHTQENWRMGYKFGVLENCFAAGNVFGELDVGGLVGVHDGSMENCYAYGNVNGTWNVGGLVGYRNYYNDNYRSLIFNSFYCINYTIGKNMQYVSPYGIYKNQFEDWVNKAKSLDIDDYLSKIPTTNNYNISSVSDMKMMLPFALDPGYEFIQTADFDLSNEAEFYIPILKSEYDGDGHSISYLETTYNKNDNFGMFGIIHSGGRVENVAIIECNISGNDQIGGLAGFNEGTILNCYVQGNVGGNDQIGGLAGFNSGTILNCNVHGNIGGNDYVGGLIGYNDGSVKNCYTRGNVKGNESTGGLVGYNYGRVENCYATGNVTGLLKIGGLVGFNEDTVENCHATGKVSGKNYIGGLVGYNGAFVENCHAAGKVDGEDNVGGLIGYNDGKVETSFSLGNVTGALEVGGLVGYYDHLTSQIINSYYCIDYVAVNNKHYVTPYGIYKNQFEDWIYGGKSFDIDDHLSKIHSTKNYNISSVSDMKKMLPFATYPGYKFKQTANIDLSSESFFYLPVFKGKYYGNAYSISNLNTTYYNNSYVGLFGIIYSGGSVDKVSLINANVSGEQYVGGMIGYNYENKVENCHAAGNVWGNDEVGGLVGYNFGTVENSNATCSVSGDSLVGGLIGSNEGTVEYCYASGHTSGNNDNIGGLVGRNSDKVLKCYASGDVTGNQSYVGGLVGDNDGTVENCYARGKVYGVVGNVGGLAGNNDGVVENCYATGLVTGFDNIGGLLGSGWGGIEENSFWDRETSGQLDSNGGRGRTTNEMLTKSTYTKAGWDFNNVWEILEYVDYPFLQWEMRPEIYLYDFDNDSIPDIRDDFPFDHAASLDTDGDGYPDQWNAGINESISTNEWYLDAFPLDPAASLDSDNDSMPDKWNPGMDQSASTSIPKLEIDPYPNDPDNKIEMEQSNKNNWSRVLLNIMMVLFIIVIIGLIIVKKKKPPVSEEDFEFIDREK